MSSRKWEADRVAVFERDRYTCAHCGESDDRAVADRSASSVRVTTVGDIPLEGTIHESLLVTVCDDCFTILHGANDDPVIETRTALFDLVRETTQLQSDAIAAVASFASLTTRIPAALEAGDHPDYTESRRTVRLALSVIDRSLELLETYAASGNADADVSPPLEAFCETARTLQTQLVTVVDLSETVVSGLGRCHGCFSSVAADSERCPTCRLERLEASEWRRDDGTVEFEELFPAVNDALQATTGTTKALTERTQRLAETLVDS